MIEGAIGRQQFELIRDRIATILLAELNNQATLQYEPEFNVDKIYIERFTPVNQSECEGGRSVINIQMERGDYSRKDMVKVDGTYRYFIEVTTKGRALKDGDDITPADQMSKVRLQKMLGLIRAIIDNPIYTTLAFPAPSINNRHIETIMFSKPEEHSMDHTCEGFLVLVVRVPENSNLQSTQFIGGLDTVVKIALTENGYVFTGDTFPVPPLIGSRLFINGTDFTLIPEGEDLELQVLDEDGNPVGSKIADDVWQVPNSGGGSGTVKNSDDSFDEEVETGETLVLEDYTVNSYIGGVLFDTQDVPAMVDITVNFN